MTYTMSGTRVVWEWCPLAMANGMEWGVERAGFPDRFNCLYNRGAVNKVLWYLGAFATLFYSPTFFVMNGEKAMGHRRFAKGWLKLSALNEDSGT